MRTAISDAASVASLMATTEAAVVDAEKKEIHASMGGGGDNMGGDMGSYM